MNTASLHWIERQKPALVVQAEKYLEEHKIFERVSNDQNEQIVSVSQLRNLLNAARTGEPLVVIQNYLRYQIGRGKKGWKNRPSGEALVGLLDSEVGKRIESLSEIDPVERFEVESRLAALLLGYIIRQYTYKGLVSAR